MDSREERARAIIDQDLEWYHSIELAPGVVTPGRSPLERWNDSLASMRLPDLTGASVLDIGACDGFFSFAAERGGAKRVVALDHYVWSTDMVAYMADWRASQRDGTFLPAPHESRHWHPDDLPGRRPFDAARALFDSRVEAVVGDFMAMDLSPLGRFDVVLFLGVLYHMEDPVGAMRRVREVTAPGGLTVIQTEAMEIAGLEDTELCRFFPGRELNNDPTNWWVPNARALEGLCRAAGFDEVTILTEPPRPDEPSPQPNPTMATRVTGSLRRLAADVGIGREADDASATGVAPSPVHYRLIAHAR